MKTTRSTSFADRYRGNDESRHCTHGRDGMIEVGRAEAGSGQERI